jgi:hypothetical protein
VHPHHPSEPRYYLPFIGVDSLTQRRGVGRALVAPVLAKCDRDGIVAYLEEDDRSNLFHERKTFPATYATAVAIMSATASHTSPCITRHSLSCFSVVDGTWQGYARLPSVRECTPRGLAAEKFPRSSRRAGRDARN